MDRTRSMGLAAVVSLVCASDLLGLQARTLAQGLPHFRYRLGRLLCNYLFCFLNSQGGVGFLSFQIPMF